MQLAFNIHKLGLNVAELIAVSSRPSMHVQVGMIGESREL